MKQSNRCQGHSFIEVGMISALVAVLAMFCANVTILMVGSSVNDAACRDAARAAAQADSVMGARFFAKAALGTHKSSMFVSEPEIEKCDYSAPRLDPITGTVDKKGPPPYAFVATKLTVKVPAPLLMLGMKFEQGGTITFRQSYRYPVISISEPDAAGAQAEQRDKDK